MTSLTIFSAPKPFTNPHIAVIQRNAIQSWTKLPDVQIILTGDEAGIADAAREFGVTHLPDVKRTPSGTPLISSMFDLARSHSDSPHLCITNADIILLPDLLDALKNVSAQRDRFLLIGQRWDIDIREPLDFSPGWIDRLRSSILRQGLLHKPAGSDYFLFPRDCYSAIPDLVIGRAGWDNWMIYKARSERWTTIDATADVMIIHQNHDYSHLPGGRPHYDHPETNENIRLAGGQANIRYTIVDADARLVNGKIAAPKITGARIKRGFELLIRKIFSFLPEDTIETIARPQRWQKRLKKLIKR
jgi:hypothetical protein